MISHRWFIDLLSFVNKYKVHKKLMSVLKQRFRTVSKYTYVSPYAQSSLIIGGDIACLQRLVYYEYVHMSII